MLKPIYEKTEDIPQKYRDLYKEVDGKFVFDGVEGISQTNVNRLEEALRKEREVSKGYKTERDETRTKLDSWEALGVDNEEAKKRIDGYTGNSKNQEEFESALKDRTELMESRHNHEITKMKKDFDALQLKNNEYSEIIKMSKISSAIDVAMEKSGIRAESKDFVREVGRSVFNVDDNGNVIANRDLNGAKAGMTPDEVFTAWKGTNPHLWGETTSGGSLGGGTKTTGVNPFSQRNWNVTAQIEYAETHGQEAADALLAEAKSQEGKAA